MYTIFSTLHFRPSIMAIQLTNDSLLPRGNLDNRACKICSDSKKQIEHGHFSSEYKRLEAIKNSKTLYFCHSCKQTHGVAIQSRRRKVVLCDSTLHNAFTDLKIKRYFHMDIDSIPGAKVWDLERAFTQTYAKDSTPVDIVLIAGINQIKSQSVKEIMASYKSISEALMKHSHDNSHKCPNTVTISTLLYPPKFCDFRESSHPIFPSHLTPKTNLLSKIDQINQEINNFNLEVTEGRRSKEKETFALHSYGVRHGKGGREHRWNMWFEKEDAKKLHLTHEWRGKILDRIQLYFTHNTDW